MSRTRRHSRQAWAVALLLAVSCVGSAVATTGRHNDSSDRSDPATCFRACVLSLEDPQFADVDAQTPPRARVCLSRLHQASLFLCRRRRCGRDGDDDDDEDDGLAALNHTCTVAFAAPLPPCAAVLAAYPRDVEATLRRLRRDEAASTTRLDGAVVVADRLYADAYDTLDALAYVETHHVLYAADVLLLWLAVVLYGVGHRLAAALAPVLRRPRVCVDDDEPPHGVDGLEDQLVYGGRLGRLGCLDRLRASLRRRVGAQTLALAALVALDTVACVAGYRVFAGHIYWPRPTQQVLRYVADRTGWLAVAHLPPLWLFGVRNSGLRWLMTGADSGHCSGWGVGAVNRFHRWSAAAATALAFVHSAAYCVLVWRDGGLADLLFWWSQYFWWTGSVATLAMCFLVGLSVVWIRRRAYAFFLAAHIMLSVLVLFGLAGHVSIFHGRYDVFWVVCAAVWGLDYLLRLLRILAFHPRPWPAPRAVVTYDARADLVRIVVPCAASLYAPLPGTYFYLHVLHDRCFWEGHPFTAASVPVVPVVPVGHRSRLRHAVARHSHKMRRATATAVELLDPYAADTVPLLRDDDQDHGHVPSAVSATSATSAPPPADAAVTFLIRPYGGLTARLRDTAVAAAAAATSAGGPASVRVLVDGPYGGAQRYDDGRFDGVLFVVGGTGVVLALAHLTGHGHARLLRQRGRRELPSAQSRPPALRSIRVVWAVREAALAADVLRRDLGPVLAKGPDLGGVRVDVDIYVTATDPANEPATHSTASTAWTASMPDWRCPASLPPGVRVHDGRPDVGDEVACAAMDGQRLAVVACGPKPMADATQHAVADVLGRPGVGDVAYFEESFET